MHTFPCRSTAIADKHMQGGVRCSAAWYWPSLKHGSISQFLMIAYYYLSCPNTAVFVWRANILICVTIIFVFLTSTTKNSGADKCGRLLSQRLFVRCNMLVAIAERLYRARGVCSIVIPVEGWIKIWALVYSYFCQILCNLHIIKNCGITCMIAYIRNRKRSGCNMPVIYPA